LAAVEEGPLLFRRRVAAVAAEQVLEKRRSVLPMAEKVRRAAGSRIHCASFVGQERPEWAQQRAR